MEKRKDVRKSKKYLEKEIFVFQAAIPGKQFSLPHIAIYMYILIMHCASKQLPQYNFVDSLTFGDPKTRILLFYNMLVIYHLQFLILHNSYKFCKIHKQGVLMNWKYYARAWRNSRKNLARCNNAISFFSPSYEWGLLSEMFKNFR